MAEKCLGALRERRNARERCYEPRAVITCCGRHLGELSEDLRAHKEGGI
jgi:hypothetical protein